MKKAIQGLNKDFPHGIPKCGADALRLGLLNDEIKLQQVNLDVNVIKSSRDFCNKMWQASRLFLLSLDRHRSLKWEDTFESRPSEALKLSSLQTEDWWILSRCWHAVSQTNLNLENYDFHLAVRSLKTFFKQELCDVYLEAIKPELSEVTNRSLAKLRVLHLCLMTSLKLFHPIMPFVTEELFQIIRQKTGEQTPESIMNQSFPSTQEVRCLLIVCEVHSFIGYLFLSGRRYGTIKLQNK